MTQAILRERIETCIRARRAMEDNINAHVALSLLSCGLDGPWAELSYRPVEWDLNMAGSLHGGVIATVFDMSMGNLCRALCPEESVATVSLNVSYLRAVRLGEPLRCVTRVIRLGGRLIHLSSELFAGGQEPAAAASGIFSRIKR